MYRFKNLFFLIIISLITSISIGCYEDNNRGIIIPPQGGEYNDENLPEELKKARDEYFANLNNENQNDEMMRSINDSQYDGFYGPYGGPKGHIPYSLFPVGGEKLIGLHIEGRAYVDSISVWYKNPQGHVRYASSGYRGGRYKTVLFHDDEYIIQVVGRYKAYIDNLKFYTNYGEYEFGGPKGSTTFTINLPPDQAILGFSGRCGDYIDNINFYSYRR